jgi:hypothetical protein
VGLAQPPRGFTVETAEHVVGAVRQRDGRFAFGWWIRRRVGFAVVAGHVLAHRSGLRVTLPAASSTTTSPPATSATSTRKAYSGAGERQRDAVDVDADDERVVARDPLDPQAPAAE